MSDPIRDAYLKAVDLISVANKLHFALLGLAKPRRAIEQWAKLDCLLRPDQEKSILDPREISSIESTVMTARDNKLFRWFDREFTCVHRAAEILAEEISFAVNTSINSGPGLTIVIVDVDLDASDPAEWKAAYVKSVQGHGLLDLDGEPTDAWPAFQERYQRAVARTNWDADCEARLQTALRLEANTMQGAKRAADKKSHKPRKNNNTERNDWIRAQKGTDKHVLGLLKDMRASTHSHWCEIKDEERIRQIRAEDPKKT
jgi:hypothetical protein